MISYKNSTLSAVIAQPGCLEELSTLQAAADYGLFTESEAKSFLHSHGLTFEEAHTDLGESVLNAHTLCLWLGY